MVDPIVIPEEVSHVYGGTAGAQAGAKMVETFVLWGGLNAEDTVLDIGCGPGRMAIGIGERFGYANPSYVGFDVRRKDVEFCQDQIGAAHPNFRFEHVNAQSGHYNPKGTMDARAVRFPVEDGSIDFCFATSVFTHMFAAETAYYFEEIARVTRGRSFTTWFVIEDGFDAHVEAGGNPRFTFAQRNEDGTRDEHADRPGDATAHTWEAVQRYHADAGLEIVDFHRGAWSRRTTDYRHSQDVVVARKR